MSAPTQPTRDPKTLAEQLNQLSIDPHEIYALRDVQIARDRVRIYFNRGFVGFLSEVAGEVTGAVFSGSGEVLLTPPNLVERQSLAQFTQSPILEEQFISAYIRFTDRTARELLTKARKPDPDDSEQPDGFAESWRAVVQRLNPAYSARILEDLVGDRSRPYFQARFQGEHLGVFEITDDERAPEALTLGTARHKEGKLYSDVWCSFPSKASESRRPDSAAAAKIVSYRIDTTINADRSLTGRAELEIESRSSVDRALVLELSRWLKVTEAREAGDEQGQKLLVLEDSEESEVAQRSHDWIMVVLPSAHPAAQRYRLRFAYEGRVIQDAGNGVLYVGARGSWYPNQGRGVRATYDLIFHYPSDLTLVASGSRVSESVSEGLKHSRWISDGPVPVAGFNLGAYFSRARRTKNATIEVYATREAETALEKLHATLHPNTPILLPSEPPTPARMRRMAQPDIHVEILPNLASPLTPSALLDSVADRAARAVQYFETLFGPIPYPRLAISQIPGGAGQGWPELVYLPTLSFLSEAQQVELETAGRSLSHSSSRGTAQQTMVLHEIAHQWWGNQVGWKTYRDQWLSEGLPSYAAALYLTTQKDGERKLRELLRNHKADLLGRTREGATVESGGAIWLGQRLSNSMNPEGYNNIVYKKSCWVFHMLRRMMTDPKTGSDERFFQMLREFAAAYRNRDPSTEDFVHHAEKYMTRAMDLDHNRQLDWFFKEWVYGTGVPVYKLHVTTQPLDGGKFAVRGRIQQSDVPADFEMLVPVAAVFGKDKRKVLGRVAVTDAGGGFQFTTAIKPDRVTIEEDEILALVR